MPRLTEFLDKHAYNSFEDYWDIRLFRQVILKEISREMFVLDYGAGDGDNEFMNFKGKCQFIAGVDIEPEVVENSALDEAKLLKPNDYAIPYPSEHFDLIISCNSVEHVEFPGRALSELGRVLKPGGLILVKTPNKYHYVATMARLTPQWFHERFNAWRGRDSSDTFPTYYRFNSMKDILRATRHRDLELEGLTFIEGRPEYLRLIAPAYLLGMIYERLVNKYERLRYFRSFIIARLRKSQCQ
jgi:SAM-dependent methyltransferase